MRFLLNENMSRTVIRTLRERGHDVLSAKESLQGLPDEDVLARAQQEHRLGKQLGFEHTHRPCISANRTDL